MVTTRTISAVSESASGLDVVVLIVPKFDVFSYRFFVAVKQLTMMVKRLGAACLVCEQATKTAP